MAEPPLLSLRAVSLRYGVQPLYQDLDLSLYPGERVALVGRNGSGKSSLFRLLSGVIEPDAGERIQRPGLRIALLEQEPDFTGFATLEAFMMAPLAAGDAALPAHQVAPLARLLQVDLTRSPRELSGGEKRRAALTRVLAYQPDVLLLDEPTNHLDIQAIEWLEHYLRSYPGTLITISHDRRFLSQITNRVFWLDGRQARRIPRGFAQFDDWLDNHLQSEAQALQKLTRKIAEETRWSVQGISARRRRNQGRLRALERLRAERRDRLMSRARVTLDAEDGERSSKRVFDAEGLKISLGDRVLLHPFDLRVKRGDRLGIIGPNGVGKSTLLKALINESDAGVTLDYRRLRRGKGLTPTWLDQNRQRLDLRKTLWETLADSGGDSILVQGRLRHVVAYARDFLFSKDQVKQPIASLSGGERNRLLLAKALANPSNLLILDEPTNDLDAETLDVLQDMLGTYEGTLLLVSHDRDFLDRIVTETLLLDGEGNAIAYAGGYQDMLAQRRANGLPDTPWVSLGSTGKGASTQSGPAPSHNTTKSASAAAQPSSRPVKRKPGFGLKEAVELRAVTKQMEALQANITRLEGLLAAPDFYTQDPDGFARAGTALTQAQQQLTRLEERWLALESLREEAAAEER